MEQIIIRNKTENLVIAAIIIVLLYVISCVKEKDHSTNNLSTQDTIFQHISPQEVYTLIQNHQDDPDFIIIDVRTSSEFDGGHIENAVNIDYYSDTFHDQLNQLYKEKVYLIYCHSGARSGSAFDIMKGLNFIEVYDILGGITAWINAGLPVIK